MQRQSALGFLSILSILSVVPVLPVLALSMLINPVAHGRDLDVSRVPSAVTQRIQAFNQHDIDAFLQAHAEDVRIYEYPDQLIGSGRSHLKRIFAPQFARQMGSVEVRDQYVIADRVVSNEYLTLGKHTEHIIVIYTIANGRIAELRLIEP